MNKNSQSQLVEDLMSIAKLGSSEVEGLKGTFYFDDLIKLIKGLIIIHFLITIKLYTFIRTNMISYMI